MRHHPSFSGAANITFELGGNLLAVGVSDLDRLVDLGAREAWLRLRTLFPQRGDLRTLLALQGAIEDQNIEQLEPGITHELRTWRQRHLADEGPDVRRR
jgi:hypothetical protein